MDIVKALKREERKIEKSVKNGMKHLEALRASIKVFAGGLVDNRRIGKRRKMSAAGSLAISKATKARWAKFHAAKATPRRKMSAAGRASIVKAQKARWAKVRAAKKASGSTMSAATKAVLSKAAKIHAKKAKKAA
jgi:hypothetical protein